MIIDLMYFNGCPHWRQVLNHLESLRNDPGGFEIRLVEVATPEAADAWHFHGSPSVAINGVDPFSNPQDPVGLTCRTYESDQGMTGSPTREQLRQAIISAK